MHDAWIISHLSVQLTAETIWTPWWSEVTPPAALWQLFLSLAWPRTAVQLSSQTKKNIIRVLVAKETIFLLNHVIKGGMIFTSGLIIGCVPMCMNLIPVVSSGWIWRGSESPSASVARRGLEACRDQGSWPFWPQHLRQKHHQHWQHSRHH